MKPKNHPCFNCPDKVPPSADSNGCKASCAILKEYEEQRLAGYEERKERYVLESEVISYRKAVIAKMHKQRNPNRYGK